MQTTPDMPPSASAPHRIACIVILYKNNSAASAHVFRPILTSLLGMLSLDLVR